MLSRAFSSIALAFRSLRNRNYRLFWFGQLVSLAGTWMQDVALSWLVLTLTDSPEALGLTMTIRFLPALFLSLYGGVLADRLPKRKAITGAQIAQMLVALALAVLYSTDLITVGLIYVLAGLRGLVDSIEGPTRLAFVSEMVGREDLPNAIALNSTLFNAARIAGPAVGAAVISTLGLGACFYLNAASFAAVIGALLAMRPEELRVSPRVSREGSFQQLREGLRYARSTPDVVLVLIIMGALGAFGYNFMTMTPLVTKYVLFAGASTLALLTTSMGAGSVIGGLFVAWRARPTRRRLLVSAVWFTLTLAATAVSRWEAVTAILMLVLGFTGILFMTTANTRLQLSVPGHIRGRVMGMYGLLFVGTTPIGSYLIGWLAETVGVVATVLGMAGLCAIGVSSGLMYARRALPPGTSREAPRLAEEG